jgi:hypothetical protein
MFPDYITVYVYSKNSKIRGEIAASISQIRAAAMC